MGVEERRRQLLELGKKVFAENAYDELSTDDLARLAGVSTGLLYHYFPSKRDYYRATISEVARQVLEDTKPIEGASPTEAVHRSLEGFVRFIENNDRLYRALVSGGIGSDREVTAILQSLRDESARRVIHVLDIAHPSPKVLLVAFGWIGFIEFTCLRWVESPTLSREQLLRLLDQSLMSLVADLFKDE
jgi:AcrR family transcriptional regulator